MKRKLEVVQVENNYIKLLFFFFVEKFSKIIILFLAFQQL